ILSRGRFRGMERAEYPNVGFALVFEGMTSAARQVDAGARSELGITFVGPQASFPFKDVHRLFVRMVVHRRASTRYYANELGHALTAQFPIEQDFEGTRGR